VAAIFHDPGARRRVSSRLNINSPPENELSPVLDPRLVKESFAAVEPVADKVAGYFYARLFLDNPELRDMFPPAMDLQRERLLRALLRIVHGIDRPDFLANYLEQLGRDHRKFGVKPEHYEAVGRALIAAMKAYAEESWTPQLEAAWVAAYSVAAQMMIEAARRAALDSPEWWLAEIVAHEQRTRDIAVLWLRPDAPFTYEPGQYVSVETPWWPRVWRTYSMANAPRRDGLLELHVRALDAGWVSTALVSRARVGDVVRLGHPMGTMVSDRTSKRNVVCVAGGTGLAPMKAIIEDMGRWNTMRRVHLFVGARIPEDLYDLRAVHALTRRHEWLTVVPAVSDDPLFRGERGNICDVAVRYGTWTDHDVYICGSAEMVRATIDRFLTVGVSMSRIRFDAFTDF
jgi:NAD(P)H-flavin reductase/hemoglobin-like flavoprotein